MSQQTQNLLAWYDFIQDLPQGETVTDEVIQHAANTFGTLYYRGKYYYEKPSRAAL